MKESTKKEKISLAIMNFADFFQENAGKRFSTSELRKKKFVSNENFKTFLEANFFFIKKRLQKSGFDLKIENAGRFNKVLYYCFKKGKGEEEILSDRERKVEKSILNLSERMDIVEKYLREYCEKYRLEQETENERRKREQKCSELASFLIENTNKFIMKSELSKAGIVSRNFKTFMEENIENIEKKLNSQGYELEVEKGEKTSVFYRCVKMRK